MQPSLMGNPPPNAAVTRNSANYFSQVKEKNTQKTQQIHSLQSSFLLRAAWMQNVTVRKCFPLFALCRLPWAHDPQWLQVPLPGSVSAHHEALRLHVCQPRWEKGQAKVARPLFSPTPALFVTDVLIGFLLCVSQAVEELLTELDVDRRSVVVGASRVRALNADPVR